MKETAKTQVIELIKIAEEYIYEGVDGIFRVSATGIAKVLERYEQLKATTPPEGIKTAEEVLAAKTPMGEYPMYYHEETILAAMEEYAKQFK